MAAVNWSKNQSDMTKTATQRLEVGLILMCVTYSQEVDHSKIIKLWNGAVNPKMSFILKKIYLRLRHCISIIIFRITTRITADTFNPDLGNKWLVNILKQLMKIHRVSVIQFTMWVISLLIKDTHGNNLKTLDRIISMVILLCLQACLMELLLLHVDSLLRVCLMTHSKFYIQKTKTISMMLPKLRHYKVKLYRLTALILLGQMISKTLKTYNLVLRGKNLNGGIKKINTLWFGWELPTCQISKSYMDTSLELRRDTTWSK